MTVEVTVCPADETSITELFRFILPMAGEVALAPVSIPDALAGAAIVVGQGNTYVARDAGEIVGSLGFVETPYWYADRTHSFFIDRWLYVRPDKRFGAVGIKLLRAGRDLGKRTGKSVFVMIANPDRRPPDNAAALYATVAGYTPFAKLLKLA